MKKPTLFLGILLVSAGASHAVVLIQDDFSNDGALNGSTPDVSITGGNWVANSVFSVSGGVVTKTTGNFGGSVALGGTLASGGIYNISATIAFAANAAAGSNVWGIGLSQTNGTAYTSGNGDGGSPWIFIRENGGIEFRALPANNAAGQSTIVVAQPGSPPNMAAMSYVLRLSINTTGPTWVASAFLTTNGGLETQLDLNGASAGQSFTYSSNPTVAYAGITSTAASNTIGSLDNFLMEGPLPVPEPSAALLGAIGALGFCSLRKRRA